MWSFRVLAVLLLVLFVLSRRRRKPPSHRRMPIIQYELVETGTITRNGLDFMRYRAVNKSSQTPLSVQEWTDTIMASSMNDGEHASDSLTRVLQTCPYKAFFWELKGVSSFSARNKDFGFVLVNAPRLSTFAESHPDESSFQEKLDACPHSQDVCVFENLGGDAMLVSPICRDDSLPLATFSHLAIFVRTAPLSQVRHFWNKVADTYQQQYNHNTVWLSTEGSGVAWLHVRIDRRPKYYHYHKFANET